MHSDAYKWFRPWTIQDAKDGDVLICGNQTFLFKCIEEKQVYCYGYIWRNEYKNLIGFQFLNQPNQLYCYTDAVMSPATKKQRDTLFAMMKEAGYSWDAENKELNKIEQNPDKVEPKFKVGDWIVYNDANVYQVKEIDYTNIIPRYELENIDGDKLSIPFTSDYNLRNWTIEDAEDGDVLFSKHGDDILIFRNFEKQVINLLIFT